MLLSARAASIYGLGNARIALGIPKAPGHDLLPFLGTYLGWWPSTSEDAAAASAVYRRLGTRLISGVLASLTGSSDKVKQQMCSDRVVCCIDPSTSTMHNYEPLQ